MRLLLLVVRKMSRGDGCDVLCMPLLLMMVCMGLIVMMTCAMCAEFVVRCKEKTKQRPVG